MYTHKVLIPERPIAFNREFVRLGLGAGGALFLSQALYWTPRTKDVDGWFYKTVEDWEEETGLTRKSQLTVKKQLTQMNILEIEKRGVPATNYFRVNVDVLAELLVRTLGDDQKCQKGTTGSAETGRLVVPKGDDSQYAENTQESTTERAFFVGVAFNEFWKLYPNKKGKDKAQKVFEKMFAKLSPIDAAALKAEVLSGIEKQRRLKSWGDGKGKFGKYVPHPTTWLNGGRWQDELNPDELWSAEGSKVTKF